MDFWWPTDTSMPRARRDCTRLDSLASLPVTCTPAGSQNAGYSRHSGSTDSDDVHMTEVGQIRPVHHRPFRRCSTTSAYPSHHRLTGVPVTETEGSRSHRLEPTLILYQGEGRGREPLRCQSLVRHLQSSTRIHNRTRISRLLAVADR